MAVKVSTPGKKLFQVAPSHGGGWRVLSSSGMSGIALGGLTGAAVAGPLGAVVGMVVGGVAGEALERQFPSKSENGTTPRAS
jgi:hypothetical protein